MPLCAACLILLGLSACRQPEPPPPLDGATVAVLPPVLSSPAAEQLYGIVPEAQWLSPAHLRENLLACRESNRVVLVPDAHAVSLEMWEELERHRMAGGWLLYIGREPLADGVREVDGQRRSSAEVLAVRVQDAVRLPRDLPITEWAHHVSSGESTSAVQPVQNNAPPWPASWVDVEDFAEWDMVFSPMFSDGLAGGDANALALYLSGDANTTRLVLEAETRARGRWIAVVPLSLEWQLAEIRASDFLPAAVPANRVKSHAQLEFSEVIRLKVGLHNLHGPQAPGSHRFGLSEPRLMTVPDARIAQSKELFFTRPGIRYAERGGTAKATATDRTLSLGSLSWESPKPGPRGTGGSAFSGARWTPVFQVDGPDGWPRGWPASCYAETPESGPGRRWGWIGLDIKDADPRTVQVLIAETVDRLRTPAVFTGGGCEQFVYEPDAMLRVLARCLFSGADREPVRVVAELVDARGEVLRRTVSKIVEPPEDPASSVAMTLTLGLLPDVKKEPQDFLLRMAIEDYAGERVFDRFEQALKVVPSRDDPDPDEWLKVTGTRFTHFKRPVFLLGVSYEPDQVRKEEPRSWLAPDCFDPDLLRRDLARLAGGGINVLTLALSGKEQLPQLQYVIEEARAAKIWLGLAIDKLDPLGPDVEEALELMDAAGLKQEPQVFAVCLSRRRYLGDAAERSVYDRAWETWLVDQFGSIEQAEQVLGKPVWRKAGRVTGPPDAALSRAGPYPMVAAYRRFIDDTISRRHGVVRRALGYGGFPQLVTAYTGIGQAGIADGFFPLDAAAIAAHVDFISICADSLRGDTDQLQEAAFLSLYGRAVSDGRPVVWCELAYPLGEQPRMADLVEQADAHRRLLDTALSSRVAGSFGVCGESAVMGGAHGETSVLAPHGFWRPVGDVFRKFSNRLRGERNVPRAWRGRQINRDLDARGVTALWEQWRKDVLADEGLDQAEELRPVGFARLTTEMPCPPADEMAKEDSVPYPYANAEWGEVRVSDRLLSRTAGKALNVQVGETLSLEIMNTGPATWAGAGAKHAGLVTVLAQHPERRPMHIKMGALPYGEHTRVLWTASEVGSWTLRPYLAQRGPFGEPLLIDVAPHRPRLSPASTP